MHAMTRDTHTGASPDARALARLGAVVRARRRALGLSQARVAERSGLSLRFLAQLETGAGNISYLRLCRVAEALEMEAAALVERAQTPSAGRGTVVLLGMRGAGKSTVGPLLADRLGVPFYELDDLVEEAAGMPLDQIFELQGEAYYRRLEREALSRFLDRDEPAVLAAGGGIVTERQSVAWLKRHTRTVWLKAEPRDHWNRVLAQGDRRPMQDRPDAMQELERLWAERSRIYAQSDFIVETSGTTAEAVCRLVVETLDSVSPPPVIEDNS